MVTNTLAYQGTELFRAVKSFLVPALLTYFLISPHFINDPNWGRVKKVENFVRKFVRILFFYNLYTFDYNRTMLINFSNCKELLAYRKWYFTL
jgi:hypothetical protein